MSVKIEAKDLQSAYLKAAEELHCSVTDLTDIKIIQNPSRGLFGLFKKDAIIEANCSSLRKHHDSKNSFKESKNDSFEYKKDRKKRSTKYQNDKFEKNDKQKVEKPTKPVNISNLEDKKEPLEIHKEVKEILHEPKTKQLEIDHSIFDTFHKSDDAKNSPTRLKLKPNDCIDEIRSGLEKLFKASCFEIEISDVSEFDNETLFIKLDGADAALLIGKEGYRYKAISYLLFNWINSKYNLGIRLEIAEFLKNQESGIAAYLSGVIDRVETTGRAQTKPLDGVLVKIALEQLRQRFPNKYVGIKSGDEGRYVVVNDFYKK
ncbi:Jag N-terminal domain-containing protein [Campylobacter fetus]|uniref:Jag N-terminal domain-containing protein n=1 Tax=Campylobacter fetus TaxID=196 RepID=UPI0003E3EF5C|nr:Jag N-terminal domain-containing protein [Campylobacter fetus]OCS26080.1 hypothetical protein CFVB10_05360 [Campylobacter fetus subsp. venerealis cfvB10]AIR80252.1 putative RNA-binding protein (Jag domain) [Campylobacter fetus subsp. venerealis 97/608]PHJ03966.1 hypothetical protein IW21_06470 [Campylobacter fetus subsp. venerealis]PHJ05036.1 hypothetical protein IW23_06845 [Campylobacter fetus subsp. venerealis]QMS63534.1 Jag N-terminal domain-containing protein [Campylobacter fetus]